MKQTVEQLAEKLIHVEPGDLPALAEVHTLLEQLVAAGDELTAEWAGPLSKASADAVQRLILDEEHDPLAALEEVASAVTALQQLIVNERDPSEIKLPATLAPEGANTAGADPIESMIDEHAVEAAALAPAEDETPAETASAEPVAGPVAEPFAGPVAESAEEATAAPLEPIQMEGDPELTAEFITEAREHLDTANECLLTIESDPDNAETINALFRAFHTLKGVAGFLELNDVMGLAHQTENLLDAARQGEFQLAGARLDVVFDATDMMTKLVGFVADAVEGDGMLQRDANLPCLIQKIDALRHGEAVPTTRNAPAEAASADEPADKVEPAEADNDDAAVAASETTAPASETPEANHDEVPSEPVVEPDSAPAVKSASIEKAAGGNTSVKLRETVKVDSNRLDQMIDAIGELVIAEAMVTQSPDLRANIDDGMERRLSHLAKITRELQEMATSLRLMPIRSTFQRMARLARDTAKKLDKRIEFVTTGDETELDKNVVDQIGDPLVHMVRNAVDHGLEASKEARIAAGKPPIGRVELRAYHKGGSIYVEIADDGKGLDRDVILRKAVERGLVQEGEKLTDKEVYQLILEAGFSTAKVVSDVSGRGVGMDVVRKNIQKMRGQLEIQSTPGKGTTFIIRLPLTLAIIDGMVVRVGDHRYVLPLLSITRMLRPEDDRITTVFNDAEMLKADDGLLPLYRLHRLFDIEDAKTNPVEASVVVVEHEGKRVGLLIDELLGQQQIVIKSLGESMRGIEGIAGGAIMPDGKVGLIIDLDSLIRLAGGARAAA